MALVSMLALLTLVRGVAICDASGVGGNDVAVVLVEAKRYWLRVNIRIAPGSTGNSKRHGLRGSLKDSEG